MKPNHESGGVVIYLGDCREILPSLGGFDVVVADPPYGETSLDHWLRKMKGHPYLAGNALETPLSNS